jgi:hypothetical protein
MRTVIKSLWFPALTLIAISLLALPWLRYIRATHAGARSIGDAAPRTPVLIELFTSEGCSSCPPADALLEKLDRTQPVRDADMIVLSEHVDYWDDGGWRDPYSSHELSIRQSAYAQRFRLNGPYTPQMIVDGDMEFVGSDERRAIQVVESAVKTPKLPIALSSIRREGNNTFAMHIEAGPFLSSESEAPAQVRIALADDSDRSSIGGGENAGRTLKYVAVLRNLTQVGTINYGGKFSKDVKVTTENTKQANLRIIAIVQQTAVGKVLGVTSAEF